MEYGQIKGKVSIDRDGQGNLFLSRNHIVISDDAGDVICLVPYEPDGDECAEYEQLAEEIVRRLNQAAETRALLARWVEGSVDVSGFAADVRAFFGGAR